MRISFCILLLSLCCSAGDKKSLAWQTGILIDQSATLEDAGCAGNVCGGTYHRTHYTISSGNKLYIVNRTGSRLDISVNAPIKFAVNGNSVYLMDDKGKTHDCHLEQVRDVVKDPAQATQPESATDTEAIIALVSNPNDAEVNVDGAFVGNAPATLKLKPGKHTIKVTRVGYKDWSRDITALGGSQVNLMATLEKLN
jgi:hypothetical protein